MAVFAFDGSVGGLEYDIMDLIVEAEFRGWDQVMGYLVWVLVGVASGIYYIMV